MINLLSPDHKKAIRAARVNVILSRYIGILVIGIVFLLGVLYVSHTILQQTKQHALEQIEANDIKADVYSDTKAQVDQLSTGLSQAKAILNQEVRYSKVLTSLAALMPQGTIIESLELGSTEAASSPTTQSTPITLKVLAKSSTEAVALQNQFRSSPLIVSPNFQSVTETGSDVEGYPASITMTFTLNAAGAR